MLNWLDAADEETVCYCRRVTKKTVVAAITAGAETVQELVSRTGAGKGVECKKIHPDKRCCHPDLKKLLELYAPDQ